MKDSDLLLLLVEDNEDDVFLMRRAFDKARLTLPMQIVMEGRQALDYLSGVGDYANRTAFPLPAAIFLDLKLPYVHGFDILKWMRQDAVARNIPVFVLTSSPEERDRKQALELGARGYLVKPPSAQMLLDVVGSLRSGDAKGNPPRTAEFRKTQ